MLRALALSVLLLSAARAPAQDPTPAEDALTQRLDAVQGSTFGSAAAGTIAQARGALARARTLREAGDEGASERAEAIAQAATELAERQTARALESSERQAVARRLIGLRERLERAIEALERVRTEVRDAEAERQAAAAAAAGETVGEGDE